MFFTIHLAQFLALKSLKTTISINIHYYVVNHLSSHVSASEAFFDNLTVEQEFMTGVDTDKVFFIQLPIFLPKISCYTLSNTHIY